MQVKECQKCHATNVLEQTGQFDCEYCGASLSKPLSAFAAFLIVACVGIVEFLVRLMTSRGDLLYALGGAVGNLSITALISFLVASALFGMNKEMQQAKNSNSLVRFLRIFVLTMPWIAVCLWLVIWIGNSAIRGY